MAKYIFYIVLSLGLALASCSSDDDEQTFDDSYKIEFGFACGWCGGTGFIEIISEKISYKREIPCGENEGSQTNSKELPTGQWDQLVSSYNHNSFLELDYSECNVCVDGCDEIIRITKEDITHELRYNIGDTIPGLETFQEKLREFMSEFNQN